MNPGLLSNPTFIHTAFDILSWAAGLLCIKFASTRITGEEELKTRALRRERGYIASASTGAVLGAYFFGTLNWTVGQINSGSWSWTTLKPSHSVAGALFGGILAVEFYKLARNYHSSTGAIFVPALALGIAIGRVGCFLSGVSDGTFGSETTVTWAHDFGDGVLRHPVQLYESACMIPMAIASFLWCSGNPVTFTRYAFYAFVAYYSAQRFVWEYFKPYPLVAMGMNLFQFLCIALTIYAMVMATLQYYFRRQRER